MGELLPAALGRLRMSGAKAVDDVRVAVDVEVEASTFVDIGLHGVGAVGWPWMNAERVIVWPLLDEETCLLVEGPTHGLGCSFVLAIDFVGAARLHARALFLSLAARRRWPATRGAVKVGDKLVGRLEGR